VASAANRGLPTIAAVLQAANNHDWGTYDDDDDAENDKLPTFAGTLDGLDDFFEGIEPAHRVLPSVIPVCATAANISPQASTGTAMNLVSAPHFATTFTIF
jgi:hypothetical protein